MPRTTKVFRATTLSMTNKHREKITRGECIWTLQKTFSFIVVFPTFKREKNNDVSYHHYYSLAPSGESQATKG
jgi:hypothetical protein